jgi:hypothetical protein
MKKLIIKLYEILIQKIGIDRVAHFGIGVFITMLCILAFGWWGIYPVTVNSIILTFIAAKIKESLDQKKDNWDIIATMIGSIAMLGMFFFIKFAL